MEMNNSKLYIISGIFAVALLVLYVLHFTTRPSAKEMAQRNFSAMLNDTTVTLPVAFVNIDSLLLNYHFASDLTEALLRQEEGIRATLTERERALNSEIAEFERRLRNNVFISEERAQQEHQRILRQQNDLQQLAQRLFGEFEVERARLNMQMEDAIRAGMAEFNAAGGFEIIFSNVGTGTILHAHSKYDITQEVTDFLNSRNIPVIEEAE
jgi:outer membrane protein